MKMKNFYMSSAVALFLMIMPGCSQVQMEPISRAKLTENLAPILKMEKRLEQVMYYTRALKSLGKDKSKEIKRHLDIYYVYYLATNVQLAKGNMESFRAHLKLAERELDTMESILKDGFDKDLDFKERESPQGDSQKRYL